jgi:hypothetical protein
MNNDAVRVNQFDVWVIFPSLRLLDAVRYAFSLQCLVIAFIAVICLNLLRMSIWFPWMNGEHAAVTFTGELSYCYSTLSRTVFRDNLSSMLSIIGRLAILQVLIGFSGCAISRCAGFSLCKGRRTGAMSAIRLSVRQWKSIVIGLLIYLIMIFGLGVIARIAVMATNLLPTTSFSVDPAEVFPVDPREILQRLVAVSTIVVMIVLTAGWLLSLAAIGIDGCDGPESLSRGISYALSHFWRTACYAFAAAFGVWGVSAAVLWLLRFCGRQVAPHWHSEPDFTTHILAGVCEYSLLMSAVAVSYVLLRRFEDGISITEVAATRSAGTQRRQA